MTLGIARWQTDLVGVRRSRLLLAGAATVALGWLGTACGADGPGTALERGERIYVANCAQCHGSDLAGTDRGPSLLLPVYGPDQLSDEEIADAVRNGASQRLFDFGPMAGNGALSDEQIDSIIAYVRSQQAGGEPAG